MKKAYIAEFLGTFWLVFGGIGTAIFDASVSDGKNTAGVGFLGVAIAFGLTVFTGAYAFGHISGGHFNPAVSFGLWISKRFPGSELAPYIGAQVAGAIVSALLLWVIKGNVDIASSNPLATNGFGTHSPYSYSLLQCLVTEFVLTFFFLIVILGATDRRAPAGFGGAAIGLALALIHLISIPITNTSVNPARSTGPALILAINGNAELLGQVWLFWVAPIAGALLAGYIYHQFLEQTDSDPTPTIDLSE